MPEPLSEPAEIAAYLRKTEKTLANWRCLAIGPRFYKIHGRILYDMAEVRDWLDSQHVDTPQQARPLAGTPPSRLVGGRTA